MKDRQTNREREERQSFAKADIRVWRRVHVSRDWEIARRAGNHSHQRTHCTSRLHHIPPHCTLRYTTTAQLLSTLEHNHLAQAMVVSSCVYRHSTSRNGSDSVARAHDRVCTQQRNASERRGERASVRVPTRKRKRKGEQSRAQPRDRSLLTACSLNSYGRRGVETDDRRPSTWKPPKCVIANARRKENQQRHHSSDTYSDFVFIACGRPMVWLCVNENHASAHAFVLAPHEGILDSLRFSPLLLLSLLFSFLHSATPNQVHLPTFPPPTSSPPIHTHTHSLSLSLSPQQQ
jgi:hypothetical protein